MEPNKFEAQIKDKLGGRTIQPSIKSWDRLDAMLSLEEKPKKKSFVWYYVAASLFFVFGITYWILNQNSEDLIPQNTIVIVDDEDSLQTNEKENAIEDKIESNELVEKVKPNNGLVAVQNDVMNKRQSSKKAINQNKKTENEVLVENYEPQKLMEKPSYVSPEKLLASVENNNEEISITTSKKNKNNVQVDANSLLSSVETEITEEYRESTFDKLKRKFNEAKSAVVNRNYE